MQKPVPNEHPSPSSQIFIGTSDDADFPDASSRTVLVEPDPTRITLLQERFAARDDITILSGTVGDTAGQGELLVFNFPGLRSLSAPTTALTELLPGLNIRARHPVKIMTAKQLLNSLPTLPEPVHMHIQSPGSELTILRALASAGFLEKLTQLRVHCTEITAFENGADRKTVESWIQQNGFILSDRMEDDPDRPVLTFQSDPVLQNLRGQLGKAAAKVKKLEKKLKTGGESAKAGKAKLTKLAATQGSDSGHADQGRDRIATLEQQLRTARTQAEKSQRQAERCRDDLAVALRMQTLLQNDLRELQERFTKVDQERDRLQTLLQTLTPRLQQAASHLKQLSVDPDTPNTK